MTIMTSIMSVWPTFVTGYLKLIDDLLSISGTDFQKTSVSLLTLLTHLFILPISPACTLFCYIPLRLKTELLELSYIPILLLCHDRLQLLCHDRLQLLCYDRLQPHPHAVSSVSSFL